MKKTKSEKTSQAIVEAIVTPPKIKMVRFKIRGIAPLVLHRFGDIPTNAIVAKQLAGSSAKKAKKEAKDFDKIFNDNRHIEKTEGWDGIPASSFRCAMISACRLAGFKMTLAKLSVFIVPDGWGRDNTPLIKITKGECYRFDAHVRLATGVVDIASRPMFDPGWEAEVTIRFDADQFGVTDVLNLLSRAGAQVGVGEGRPDSRQSAGMGWGQFEVVE